MDLALANLGIKSYEAAGVIGFLVFLVAVLIFAIFSLYARRVKLQTVEIITAHSEVQAMRDKMEKQLENMLLECEKACDKKIAHIEKLREIIKDLERQLAVHQRNEIWFQNEIRNLTGNMEE